MYAEKECSAVTQTDVEVHLEVVEIGFGFNLGDGNRSIFMLFQVPQLQALSHALS